MKTGRVTLSQRVEEEGSRVHNYEGGMCVRSVAGVKHVRSRGHLCVWAFIRVNAVFARVCVRVC